MENLSHTIEMLFCEMSMSEVLESWHKVKEPLSCEITEDWFFRCFREKYPTYTNDQCKAVFGMLESNWLNNSSLVQSATTRSHISQSVFNVLLHFSSSVLTEKNGNPVCRYEHLLKWNDVERLVGEDLLTTSFLAAKDLNLSFEKRNEFTWEHFVEHNNAILNSVLNKGIADIHAHLKGSTFVFDLSWLSLMNSIKNRNEQFNKLNFYLYPDSRFCDKPYESLYNIVTKACLIRYVLYSRMHCQSCDFPSQNTNKRFLYQDKELISSYLENDWTSFVIELDSALASLKFFSHKYGGQCVDYAIPVEFTALDNNNSDLYRTMILSGERMFLYDMFYRIYSNSCPQGEQILFYAYLLAKNRLRKELVQINNKVGFANFKEYENRKEIFIAEKSVYNTLISNLAVNDAIKRKNSYIEARITPKETSDKLQDSIIGLDQNISNPNFIAPTQRKYRNIFSRTRIHPTRWHYILHFIKQPDKLKKKKLESGIYCRNYHLRQEIIKQAKAIACFRKRSQQNASRIVGIDAASSEIGCRPEVFAQVFRYLRNDAHHIHSNELEYLREGSHHNLGRTYHVGEDYYDIVDGLRAIEEAVLFLNLSEGDRIGHAVALGINARNYYKDNRTLEMPAQIILDDVAWLYNKIQLYGLKTDILYDLQQQFEYYFRKTFIQKNSCIVNMPSIYTYYQSWLLRGNDPYKIYINDCTYNTTIDDFHLSYSKFFRNRFSDEIRQAWENKEAQELYYAYHFDATVRKEGDKSDQFKIKDKYVEIVEEVQERMRCDMEKRHISIETNPTSNYCISTIKRYDEHPILRFNNDGLILPEGYKPHSIPVTINTDDAGVFDTNLRREFSLMALAIEKNNEVHNSPQQIYDWIDRVRNMAYVQKFDK